MSVFGFSKGQWEIEYERTIEDLCAGEITLDEATARLANLGLDREEIRDILAEYADSVSP